MLGKIDQISGFSDAAKGCFRYGFRFPGPRNYAAIVISVTFAIEEKHTRNFAHRSNDCVDFRGITAFGKIRYTLDESFHEFSCLNR